MARPRKNPFGERKDTGIGFDGTRTNNPYARPTKSPKRRDRWDLANQANIIFEEKQEAKRRAEQARRDVINRREAAQRAAEAKVREQNEINKKIRDKGLDRLDVDHVYRDDKGELQLHLRKSARDKQFKVESDKSVTETITNKDGTYEFADPLDTGNYKIDGNGRKYVTMPDGRRQFLDSNSKKKFKKKQDKALEELNAHLFNQEETKDRLQIDRSLKAKQLAQQKKLIESRKKSQGDSYFIEAEEIGDIDEQGSEQYTQDKAKLDQLQNEINQLEADESRNDEQILRSKRKQQFIKTRPYTEQYDNAFGLDAYKSYLKEEGLEDYINGYGIGGHLYGPPIQLMTEQGEPVEKPPKVVTPEGKLNLEPPEDTADSKLNNTKVNIQAIAEAEQKNSTASSEKAKILAHKAQQTQSAEDQKKLEDHKAKQKKQLLAVDKKTLALVGDAVYLKDVPLRTRLQNIETLADTTGGKALLQDGVAGHDGSANIQAAKSTLQQAAYQASLRDLSDKIITEVDDDTEKAELISNLLQGENIKKSYSFGGEEGAILPQTKSEFSDFRIQRAYKRLNENPRNLSNSDKKVISKYLSSMKMAAAPTQLDPNFVGPPEFEDEVEWFDSMFDPDAFTLAKNKLDEIVEDWSSYVRSSWQHVPVDPKTGYGFSYRREPDKDGKYVFRYKIDDKLGDNPENFIKEQKDTEQFLPTATYDSLKIKEGGLLDDHFDFVSRNLATTRKDTGGFWLGLPKDTSSRFFKTLTKNVWSGVFAPMRFGIWMAQSPDGTNQDATDAAEGLQAFTERVNGLIDEGVWDSSKASDLKARTSEAVQTWHGIVDGAAQLTAFIAARRIGGVKAGFASNAAYQIENMAKEAYDAGMSPEGTLSLYLNALAIGGVDTLSDQFMLGASGAMKKILGPKGYAKLISTKIGIGTAATGNILGKSATEAGTEMAQTAYENFTAKSDMFLIGQGYDPERQITDGLKVSGYVGGFIGGGVSTFNAPNEIRGRKRTADRYNTLKDALEDSNSQINGGPESLPQINEDLGQDVDETDLYDSNREITSAKDRHAAKLLNLEQADRAARKIIAVDGVSGETQKAILDSMADGGVHFYSAVAVGQGFTQEFPIISTKLYNELRAELEASGSIDPIHMQAAMDALEGFVFLSREAESILETGKATKDEYVQSLIDIGLVSQDESGLKINASAAKMLPRNLQKRVQQQAYLEIESPNSTTNVIPALEGDSTTDRKVNRVIASGENIINDVSNEALTAPDKPIFKVNYKDEDFGLDQDEDIIADTQEDAKRIAENRAKEMGLPDPVITIEAYDTADMPTIDLKEGKKVEDTEEVGEDGLTDDQRETLEQERDEQEVAEQTAQEEREAEESEAGIRPVTRTGEFGTARPGTGEFGQDKPTGQNRSDGVDIRDDQETIQTPQGNVQEDIDDPTTFTGESESVRQRTEEKEQEKEEDELVQEEDATTEQLLTEEVETPVQEPETPAPRRRYTPEVSQAFQDDFVISKIIDEGGLLSRTQAARQDKEKYSKNKSLWDGTSDILKHPTHNKIYSDRGLYPDQVVKMLVDKNLLPEDATTDDLYDAISRASTSAVSLTKQIKQQRDKEDKQQRLADLPKQLSTPASEQIQIVDDFNKSEGAKNLVDFVPVDLDGAEEKINLPLVFAIEQVFKRKVILVEPQKGSQGDSITGVKLDDNNTLLINLEGNYNPVAGLGHEFMHTIENKNPELYNEFVDTVKKTIKDYPSFLMKVDSRYGDINNLEKEAIANLAGDLFVDPTFWNQYLGNNPTITEKLVTAFLEFLNSLANRIRRVPKKKRSWEVTDAIDDLDVVRTSFATLLTKVEGFDKAAQENPSLKRALQFAFDPQDKKLIKPDTPRKISKRYKVKAGQALPTAIVVTKTKTPQEAIEASGDVDFNESYREQAAYEINAAEMATYPILGKQGKKLGYRLRRTTSSEGKKKIADEIYELLIGKMQKNLRYLHDKMDPKLRERAKLWYEGANRIARELGNTYKITTEKAAAIIATLSPQKDWFMNVSLAGRVIDIMSNQQNTKVSQEMVDMLVEIAGRKERNSGESKAAHAQRVANLKRIKRIQLNQSGILGKKLKDLDDFFAANFVRAYDEINNSRSYPIISPEGDRVGTKTKADGTPAKVGWGTYGEIANAVGAFRSTTQAEFSSMLGDKHKVRNFYVNIVDPTNPKAITIDTHAVAAALFLPLAGASKEVLQNFGTVKGISSAGKDLNGHKGTYAVFHEAYMRTANELGILPRELQSITWEQIRTFFTDSRKKSQGFLDKVKGIWQNNDGHGRSRKAVEQATKELNILGQTETYGIPDWALSESSEDGVTQRRGKQNETDQSGTVAGRTVARQNRTGRRELGQPTARRTQARRTDSGLTESVQFALDPNEENATTGININDSSQAFTEQILSGKKTIETRDTNSLKGQVGKRVGLVRTGKGEASVVGYATIGEPVVYNDEKSFRKDFRKHRVAKGSPFDIKETKYGYPLENVTVEKNPYKPKGTGIVSRRIQFAVDPETDAKYLDLAKNPKKNEKALREMVDKTAFDAGYDSPLLYHGTTEEFNEFDYSRIGEGTGFQYGPGFYFTRSRSEAAAYREKRGKKGPVLPVYLNVDNPVSPTAPPLKGQELRSVIEMTADLEYQENLSNDPDARLEDTFLANYGGIKGAVELLSNEENIAEQLGAMQGSGIAPEHYLRAVNEVTGIDAFVVDRYAEVDRQNYARRRHGGNVGKITVALTPEQIKLAEPVTKDEQGNVIPLSKRFDSTTPNIQFALDPEDKPFYSNALAAINKKKKGKFVVQEKMSLEQAQAFANKNIKKAERNWLKLNDFLIETADENEGKVTRTQIADFIERNQFVVTEKEIVDDYEYVSSKGGFEYRTLLFHLPVKNAQDASYSSRHFGDDGENLVFHIRLKDRFTPDGRRILYIEEIQSDWATDYNSEEKKARQLKQLKEQLDSDNRKLHDLGRETVKRMTPEKALLKITKLERLTRQLSLDWERMLSSRGTPLIKDNRKFQIKDDPSINIYKKLQIQHSKLYSAKSNIGDILNNKELASENLGYGVGLAGANAAGKRNLSNELFQLRYDLKQTQSLQQYIDKLFNDLSTFDYDAVLHGAESLKDNPNIRPSEKITYNKGLKGSKELQKATLDDLFEKFASDKDQNIEDVKDTYSAYTETLEDLNDYAKMLVPLEEVLRKAEGTLGRGYFGDRITHMPFVKSYHEPALKHIVRLAAKNNYDGISWNTGAQQIEINEGELRKHVKEVSYKVVKPKNNIYEKLGPAVEVFITTKDSPEDPVSLGIAPIKGPALGGKLKGKELKQVVPGVADKIVKDIENGQLEKSYSGENLSIGGALHKMLYDLQIPKFLKEYLKPFNADITYQDVSGTTDVKAVLKSKLAGFRTYRRGYDLRMDRLNGSDSYTQNKDGKRIYKKYNEAKEAITSLSDQYLANITNENFAIKSSDILDVFEKTQDYLSDINVEVLDFVHPAKIDKYLNDGMLEDIEFKRLTEKALETNDPFRFLKNDTIDFEKSLKAAIEPFHWFDRREHKHIQQAQMFVHVADPFLTQEQYDAINLYIENANKGWKENAAIATGTEYDSINPALMTMADYYSYGNRMPIASDANTKAEDDLVAYMDQILNEQRRDMINREDTNPYISESLDYLTALESYLDNGAYPVTVLEDASRYADKLDDIFSEYDGTMVGGEHLTKQPFVEMTPEMKQDPDLPQAKPQFALDPIEGKKLGAIKDTGEFTKALDRAPSEAILGAYRHIPANEENKEKLYALSDKVREQLLPTDEPNETVRKFQENTADAVASLIRTGEPKYIVEDVIKERQRLENYEGHSDLAAIVEDAEYEKAVSSRVAPAKLTKKQENLFKLIDKYQDKPNSQYYKAAAKQLEKEFGSNWKNARATSQAIPSVQFAMDPEKLDADYQAKKERQDKATDNLLNVTEKTKEAKKKIKEEEKAARANDENFVTRAIRYMFTGQYDLLDLESGKYEGSGKAGDVLKRAETDTALIQSAAKDYKDQLIRELKSRLGLPFFKRVFSGKRRMNKFLAELHTTAARLEVASYNPDPSFSEDQFTFKGFDVRLGSMTTEAMERRGLKEGDYFQDGPDTLKVGAKLPDRDAHYFTQHYTALDQKKLYDEFMMKYPDLGIFLNRFINPTFANVRVTSRAGVKLPMFNRYALREVFGESELGDPGFIEGYTPDVAIGTIVMGAILNAKNAVINKARGIKTKGGAVEFERRPSSILPRVSKARSVKTGAARELGLTKNIIDGFAVRAVEAAMEKQSRESAYNLIEASTKPIPEGMDIVPSDHTMLDKRKINEILKSMLLVMNENSARGTELNKFWQKAVRNPRGKEANEVLLDERNPDLYTGKERQIIEFLFGDKNASKFIGEDRMIDNYSYEKLIDNLSARHVHPVVEMVTRGVEFLFQQVISGYLVGPATLLYNWLAPNLQVGALGMWRLNRAAFGALSTDPKERKRAKIEMRAGVQTLIGLTSRRVSNWSGIDMFLTGADYHRGRLKKEDMDKGFTGLVAEGQYGKALKALTDRRTYFSSVVPREIFDNNTLLSGIERVTANDSALNDLLNFKGGSGLLKIFNFHEMDPTAKQNAMYSALWGHASVAVDEQLKASGEKLSRKERRNRIRDYMKNIPRDSAEFRESFDSSVLFAFDYSNVPMFLGSKAVPTRLLKPTVLTFSNFLYTYSKLLYSLTAKPVLDIAKIATGKKSKKDPLGNSEFRNALSTLSLYGMATFLYDMLAGEEDDDEKLSAGMLGTNMSVTGDLQDNFWTMTGGKVNLDEAFGVFGKRVTNGIRAYLKANGAETAAGYELFLRGRALPFVQYLATQQLWVDSITQKAKGEKGLSTGDVLKESFEMVYEFIPSGPVLNLLKDNKYDENIPIAAEVAKLTSDMVFARTFMPGPYRTFLTRVTDPTYRRRYESEALDYNMNMWDQFVNEWKRDIPYLSRSLPPAGSLRTVKLNDKTSVRDADGNQIGLKDTTSIEDAIAQRKDVKDDLEQLKAMGVDLRDVAVIDSNSNYDMVIKYIDPTTIRVMTPAQRILAFNLRVDALDGIERAVGESGVKDRKALDSLIAASQDKRRARFMTDDNKVTLEAWDSYIRSEDYANTIRLNIQATGLLADRLQRDNEVTGIPEGAPPDFFRKLVQADHVLRDQYGAITNREDLRPIDLKLTKKYKVVKKANTPDGNFDAINYKIIKNTPSSTKYKNFVKFPLGESSDR